MSTLLRRPALHHAVVALAVSAGLTFGGAALAVSPRVENACRDDYFRYCSAYPVGSAALRLCMESKSKNLSQTCVRALIDAGEVDRRRIKRGF